jgi:argininosuccinate lyase
VLPLGSGTLAGTTLPIDRRVLADDSGFAEISPNSIDAVTDRDFTAEFLFATSLVGVHLSRLAE